MCGLKANVKSLPRSVRSISNSNYYEPFSGKSGLGLPTIATLFPVITPLSWENARYLSGFIKHNQSKQTRGKVFSSILSWTFQQKYQCPSGKGRGDWASRIRLLYKCCVKTKSRTNHLTQVYRESPCPSCTVLLCGADASHTCQKVRRVFGTSPSK